MTEDPDAGEPEDGDAGEGEMRDGAGSEASDAGEAGAGGRGDEGDGIEIRPGSMEDQGRTALWPLLAEFLRRLLGLYFDTEISRAKTRYRSMQRRLRLLGVLAFTALVFALAAFVVWTVVGVVWLVDNTPASANPFYLAVGVVVGYLASLVAGLVYSR